MTTLTDLLNKLHKHNEPFENGVHGAEQFVVINTPKTVGLAVVKKVTYIDVNEFLCEEEYEVERIFARSHDIIYGTYKSTDLIFK